MSFNHDYSGFIQSTRKDGTEVMVTFRLLGGGSDFFAGGCWHPGDPIEVEFDKVYGLPDGEELTQKEWDEIEAAIMAARLNMNHSKTM